ncbi:MAG TPA: ABC transporter ATP-binding protein [Conexibacter sp.]|jgi:branched-chain amino acid transport system ATP-binding protein
MLEVTKLSVSYGAVVAAREVSFTVGAGECVALLGPNGAGKSSSLKAVSGMVGYGGEVRLEGRDLRGMAPHRIARLGVIHVPEGRRLFPALTVHENLQVATTARGERGASYSLDDVYDLFPALVKLRSTACWSLSGGEQQMVAIGRALVASPLLLMLDEPSLGLSPKITQVVGEAVAQIRGRTSVLLVEQNTRVALDLATRVYVFVGGAIVMEGGSSQIANREALLEAYLGLEAHAV